MSKQKTPMQIIDERLNKAEKCEQFTVWIIENIEMLLAKEREIFKEFFDAGYDFRSSKLSETIEEFGENAKPDFDEFVNETFEQ